MILYAKHIILGGRTPFDAVLRIPCKITSMLFVSLFALSLTACSTNLSRRPPSDYDATRAIHAYNEFMEQTIHRIQALPTPSRRKDFVNHFRSTLEAETARLTEQIDGELKRNTLGKSANSLEFQAELARMKTLAPKLTEELRKYATD